MKTAPPRDVASSLRFLNELFARHPPRHVSVRFWDDTLWPDEQPRAATLVLKHPGALHAMFRAGTETGLAEACLNDDFDVEGDIEAAFEITDLLAERFGWKHSLSLAVLLRRLPTTPRNQPAFERKGRIHSETRDRKAIAFHYNVSNDFYRLWLDSRLVYSCAYFRDEDLDLDAAQTAKLDYICTKLRLKPGQHVLDIGCGWGGFALHAARNHGVSVTGVTLSENQASFARERAAKEGLTGQVQIELRDYRDFGHDARFDAIVSIGMSEHVGRENLASYFNTAHALLRPGGVFLNHAIGEGYRFRPSQGPSFIDKYVFPDSDIPPIHTVMGAAESAGFELRDAENLREHYALTLRHWVRRLERQHKQALAFVPETTFRVWRLYMAGSAHGFARGRLAVYQLLLAKPDDQGRTNLPLTRDDWYA